MFAMITPRATSRGAKTLNSSTSRTSSLGGRYVPCLLGPRRSRLVYARCRARWERLYRAAGLSLTGSKLREPSDTSELSRFGTIECIVGCGHRIFRLSRKAVE
jgi:hypothetical protein